jgi:hypothetical protein
VNFIIETERQGSNLATRATAGVDVKNGRDQKAVAVMKNNGRLGKVWWLSEFGLGNRLERIDFKKTMHLNVT